jgi:AcrR family transcriptional regulator
MKTRRSEILKAAYDLMGTEGLENVHARTVATHLSINHATVHYYFPHRSDLLVGVAEYALEQLRADRAKLQDGIKSSTDAIEMELALAEAYCKPASRFAKVIAGLYVASISSPAVKEKLTVLWAEWSEMLAPHLAKSKLRKSTPYADSELLTATLFGFALTSHLTNGKFDAKAKIDTIFGSLFN